MTKFFKNLWRYKALVAMALPGAVWMVFFFYIPVFANVVAFKDFHLDPAGFLASLSNSPWVGLSNFEFLFSSGAAFDITRNTILYNLGFITLNLFISISFAIIMSELRNKKLVKVYQTMSLFPYFLSWIVISYFVYAFLAPGKTGIINQLIMNNGGVPVNWYQEPKYWVAIILFIGVWKGIGYNSIVYFATVMGINPTYYEAAMVDGATKWQQIKHVTIPQVIPLMTILTILAVGHIFRADFGLFYNVPRQSGALTSVTQVLDTYIYNGLANTGDLGMATAAALYQSVVGFILLMITNFFARKLDSDSALF